ncbi:MAG: hypothetical protein WA102_00150 [Candidatus Methanoperedens sp.]
MDCCGPSKPKDTDKDIKEDQTGIKKNPVEQAHGGGCCGGGGSGMWLHLVIMIIVVVVISYLTKR